MYKQLVTNAQAFHEHEKISLNRQLMEQYLNWDSLNFPEIKSSQSYQYNDFSRWQFAGYTPNNWFNSFYNLFSRTVMIVCSN